MGTNRVAIAAVALLALLGLTVWALQGRDKAPVESGASSSFPKIDKDTLTSIEITRVGESPVVLTRSGEAWRITAPVDSEVDKNALNAVLGRIGSLESTGLVATNADNHARLEVDDSKAVVVQALTADGVAGLLRVGKYSNGNTMMRIGDSDEVHGVKGSVRYVFDRDLKNWRNRKIVDVKDADVRSIEFQHGKTNVAFDRADDGEWALRAGQKKIKDFDPKKVAGFVSTAARLTATDFAETGTKVAKTGLDKPTGTVSFVFQQAVQAKSTSDAGVENADAGAKPTELMPPETVTLHVGGAAEGEARFYLQRAGADTIFIVSKYIAERLQPSRDQFEKSKVDPNAKPPAPTGAPPGLQGVGGPGGQQLPPEVMKQLQEQLKAQGRHP